MENATTSPTAGRGLPYSGPAEDVIATERIRPLNSDSLHEMAKADAAPLAA